MNNDKALMRTVKETQVLKKKLDPSFSPNPNDYSLSLVTTEIDNLKNRMATLDELIDADPPNTYRHGHLAGRQAANEENLKFLQKLVELL